MGKGNSAIGQPPAPYSLKENMRAFDRLPKAIRHALAYSDQNWSAGSIQRERRRKNPKVKDIKDAVAFIAERDRIINTRDAARGLVCIKGEK